jgi:tRNA pseudouridine55 synthase
MPPRALRPVGVALVDKPAGPSSFALVAALRRRTRARTGHAGTLDPFATGLLVLLSGAATRLAPCFLGLDKSYLTDIDLTATTTTGDREGELIERHPAPARADLERAVERLRGEIELRVPAASAVKIDGQRAYRLARRGIPVEMPVRRTRVHALELLDVLDGGEDAPEIVLLHAHVASGTYVRALAEALGGHCTALRRISIGPFSIDEAEDVETVELLPPSAALARLSEADVSRVPAPVRAGVLALEQSAGGGAA